MKVDCMVGATNLYRKCSVYICMVIFAHLEQLRIIYAWTFMVSNWKTNYDLELSQWKSAWVASRICLCWLTDNVYRLLITYVIRLIRYVTTLGRLVDTLKINRLKWVWGFKSPKFNRDYTLHIHWVLKDGMEINIGTYL